MKKEISLMDLEAMADNPDQDFAAIETLLEDNGSLLKKIFISLGQNEDIFVSRINMIDGELSKEKENSKIKTEALKEEKEKTDREWAEKYDSLKKESNEKIEQIEENFKEKERTYRNRENELEARIYDLNEMRLKSRLKEQTQLKQKEEIQEKLKAVLEKLSILLKEEKRDR